MTLFKGILLFDIAEDPINGWENQLGYRGMMEVWRKGNREVVIEPCEDGDKWEVWVRATDDSGYWDSIGFESDFDKADKLAKEWMRDN